MKVSLIHFIILLFKIQYCFSNVEDSTQKCLNRIYKDCTHESSFSKGQLNTVRLYFQKRFSKTRPIRKPCRQIRVRKDIKCLTKQEFQDFVYVIKVLHKNGFMDQMSKIHNDYWPSVHKFGVGVPWHRWFLNIFEEEMMKVNPKVTLPYWNYLEEFAAPHLSIIWEQLGGAGKPENDYCVTDGPFANMTFKVPTPHCLRRQWKPDGTMHPWEGPEWVTALSQMGFDWPLLIQEIQLLSNWSTINTIPRNLRDFAVMFKSLDPTTKMWSQFALGITFAAHFKTHLSVGGLTGDMSHNFAPNDPVFYLFHATIDIALLSWQMKQDKNLVPYNYGLGITYDFKLGRTAVSNMETDVLPVYRHIRDKETFQMGFGELCYIYDRFVEPINELMRGKRRPLPEAYFRLKSTLPADIFQVFYPKFAYYPERVTYFDYLLTDVPKECNTKCKPTPVALDYLATPEGVRQWHSFKNDLGIDLTFVLTELENTYHKFMNYLNGYNYCSPYV